MDRRSVRIGAAIWHGALLACLLSVLTVQAQGQLINGNRTIAGALNFCVAGGTANALTCPLNPAVTSYRSGTCYLVKTTLANTAAVTLNVNGLGAKVLTKAVVGAQTALAANDLGIGQLLEACYDGTNMQAQSLGSAGGGGGSGVVSSGPTAALGAYIAAGTTLAPSTALTVNATALLTANPNVTAVSSSTTLGAHHVVACTSGASTVTLTLPGAAATTVGFYRVIKVDVGAGQCVVQAASGERVNATVDGSRAATLLNDELELTLASRTTPNWHVALRRSAWDLGTDVTGNLAVSRLNNGTNASASTVWCGNGTWCTPTGGGNLSNSGAPSPGQVAEFVSQTTVQGVAVTGTGDIVRKITPVLTSPTFTGILTGPTLLGGTLSDSILTLQSTSGAAGTDMIVAKVGTVERARYTNTTFTLGATSPTNPALRVNYGAASAVTGWDMTAQAVGAPAVLAVISLGTNEGGDISAKGSGNLRLQTTSTGGVFLGGTAPHTLGVERNTTSNTAGQPWTAPGGSATLNATDKAAGGIIFQTGLSTGTAGGLLRFQGTTTAASTGTSDNVYVDKMILGGFKVLTNNITTTILAMTTTSNRTASLVFAYGVEVWNTAGEGQVESGYVECHLLNKAGVVDPLKARCTTVGNNRDATLDTSILLVTFTVTTAGLVQVNVNSNLTAPFATGYPQISYAKVINTGTQQIATQ